ncbi:ABCB family ABC transporter ATP-binding protein/permease [Corticimicrobacter populi]|uniref:Metal ABC transporter permease n=1 Tax=Corticimicrobacter populi TaxID=2175229 RepID=A0A2V1JY03_9BURK|nr:ABC transporter ATP-binding protein/permease [Corticimicrobacter populi]PWF23764.1 metal ABC transporter permease [Corticimicrobacter populi]
MSSLPSHTGERPVERAHGARSGWSVVAGLLPYLKPYKTRIGLALGCILLAKLCNLLMPQALKQIVDDLNVPHTLLALPLGLLLAYGLARVGNTLFSELRQVVFARVMARASRQITRQVFEHLHRLSLRFHLTRRTGGVARDVERGGKAFSDLMDWTLYSIIPVLLEVLLVTAVLVYSYDWWFAAITLATLLVYGAWTILVTEWRTRYYRATIEADNRANERVVDSLLNYETVKYFNNEAHEVGRYNENLLRLENAQVKAINTLAVLNLGQSLIVAVGVTAMMALASQGVVEGSMTVGDLVLVNAYLLQLSAPLFMLGMMYREVKQALTNMENLFSLLDQRQEVRDAPDAKILPAQPPRVRFEAVHFSYDERREILHGIDFEIPAGGTLAVVGHSGSGKSTLARLLYRFYDIDSGRILIDDLDIREVTQHSLRQAIGIVPQDTVLFNDTIFYNIRYGRPDASAEEVEAAARAAQIHAFIASLPDGYDTPVGERGLKLSGGEKQRVAIARALLKNPSILIFDEATSALDSNSERAIQSELDKISVGRTTLVIAHRLSTVMNADQILVMDAGDVVERGTHEALLVQDGRYAQMWRLQQRDGQAG